MRVGIYAGTLRVVGVLRKRNLLSTIERGENMSNNCNGRPHTQLRSCTGMDAYKRRQVCVLCDKSCGSCDSEVFIYYPPKQLGIHSEPLRMCNRCFHDYCGGYRQGKLSRPRDSRGRVYEGEVKVEEWVALQLWIRKVKAYEMTQEECNLRVDAMVQESIDAAARERARVAAVRKKAAEKAAWIAKQPPIHNPIDFVYGDGDK